MPKVQNYPSNSLFILENLGMSKANSFHKSKCLICLCIYMWCFIRFRAWLVMVVWQIWLMWKGRKLFLNLLRALSILFSCDSRFLYMRLVMLSVSLKRKAFLHILHCLPWPKVTTIKNKELGFTIRLCQIHVSVVKVGKLNQPHGLSLLAMSSPISPFKIRFKISTWTTSTRHIQTLIYLL